MEYVCRAAIFSRSAIESVAACGWGKVAVKPGIIGELATLNKVECNATTRAAAMYDRPHRPCTLENASFHLKRLKTARRPFEAIALGPGTFFAYEVLDKCARHTIIFRLHYEVINHKQRATGVQNGYATGNHPVSAIRVG